MGKDLNRQLTKEDIESANKPTKRCSTSYVVRKFQIKQKLNTTAPTRTAKTPNSDSTECWRNACGHRGPRPPLAGTCNRTSTLKTGQRFPQNWTCVSHRIQQQNSLVFTQTENLGPHKNLPMEDDSRNCQNWAARWPSTGKWISDRGYIQEWDVIQC